MWKANLPAVSFAGALIAAAAVWAQEPSLPPGPMWETARAACLSCHKQRIILQQRLSRRTWTRVVDKMIGYGAPVAAGDREALVGYLAKHFGADEARPVSTTMGEGAAADKVRLYCRGCHDERIILQQRLTRAKWASVLGKMIDWGAVVPPEDREAILDYLSTNYPALVETPGNKQ